MDFKILRRLRGEEMDDEYCDDDIVDRALGIVEYGNGHGTDYQKCMDTINRKRRSTGVLKRRRGYR